MMMRWVVESDGDQAEVVWDEGVLQCSIASVRMMIARMVDDGTIVGCGFVGPDLPASLDDRIRAWGTITRALRLAGWGFLESPEVPIDSEAVLDDPLPSLVAKVRDAFSSRSIAP